MRRCPPRDIGKGWAKPKPAKPPTDVDAIVDAVRARVVDYDGRRHYAIEANELALLAAKAKKKG